MLHPGEVQQEGFLFRVSLPPLFGRFRSHELAGHESLLRDHRGHVPQLPFWHEGGFGKLGLRLVRGDGKRSRVGRIGNLGILSNL